MPRELPITSGELEATMELDSAHKDKLRAEIKRLRALLSKINSHWHNGSEGQFSASWDQDNAENGFWIPAEDADAICAALSGSVQ